MNLKVGVVMAASMIGVDVVFKTLSLGLIVKLGLIHFVAINGKLNELGK
jgi:hypothetical protein